MANKALNPDNVLCANLRIRRVTPEPADASLVVRAVCADREELRLIYDRVLYSQIDSGAEGEHIVLAEEVTPKEFCSDRHKASRIRFQNEAGIENLSAIEEISRRGYHIFTHYVGECDEYAVIAKSFSIALFNVGAIKKGG